MNECHKIDNSASSVRGCFKGMEGPEQDGNFRREPSIPGSYMHFKPRKHAIDPYILNIIGCQGEDGITKTQLKKESRESWEKLNENLAVLVERGFVVVERKKGPLGREADHYLDSFYVK